MWSGRRAGARPTLARRTVTTGESRPGSPGLPPDHVVDRTRPVIRTAASAMQESPAQLRVSPRRHGQHRPYGCYHSTDVAGCAATSADALATLTTGCHAESGRKIHASTARTVTIAATVRTTNQVSVLAHRLSRRRGPLLRRPGRSGEAAPWVDCVRLHVELRCGDRLVELSPDGYEAGSCWGGVDTEPCGCMLRYWYRQPDDVMSKRAHHRRRCSADD